ncbi:zinc finger BED domain-containing protein 4-like [Tachysurus ichikawai]
MPLENWQQKPCQCENSHSWLTAGVRDCNDPSRTRPASAGSTPLSDNPLVYWKNNHGHFPDLAKLARKYLSAPCTSTDSERLFSAAAHVLDEKRNRLDCDKAEKLLFIKKNLPLYLKK